MLDFIWSNSSRIDTAISLILMVVWIVYLNLFLSSIRRNRRPMILIARSLGAGLDARIFISNMGAEPVYITALIAECQGAEGRSTAMITQNDHLSAENLTSWQEATMQGPLRSGEVFDAGTFGSLLDRIERHGDASIARQAVDRLTLTVVAATGYSAQLAAGRRRFRLTRHEAEDTSEIRFHPDTIDTEQLRSWFASRRLRKDLNARLRAEA